MSDLSDRIAVVLRDNARMAETSVAGWPARIALLVEQAVRPRITADADLGALPRLTVLRHVGASGSLWERRTSGWLCLAGPRDGEFADAPTLPAVVIWTPEERR